MLEAIQDMIKTVARMVLNFGYGRYTEKKSPMGYTMKSKYDVYTYGANLMTGYAFESGLTPEGGLRYLLVDQKSYDDGVEKISTSNNDVLTAVLGAKYGYKVKAKDWMFTPNVRLAATYDLMSDGSQAVAAITGGSSYQISGERLHRFGMEAGVGVTSTWPSIADLIGNTTRPSMYAPKWSIAIPPIVEARL